MSRPDPEAADDADPHGGGRDRDPEPATGPEGDRDPEPDPVSGRDLDYGPPLVGLVVALAGVLFLAQPYVGTVEVAGAAIPAFVLSAGVLGTGFALGAVLFYRRGKRLLAWGHAVGSAAWLALFAAASVGSAFLVFVGVVVLCGGAFFVVDLQRRRAASGR